LLLLSFFFGRFFGKVAILAESTERNHVKEKSSPLTCYFWTRDDFLPTVECTSAQANILLALAGFANPDGTSSRPGRLNLMRTTKYDRDTIRQAINFWLSHPSRVLLRTFKGNGKTHASVYRILMPNTDSKGAEQTPLIANERGGVDAPSDVKGADKGRERGGKGADSPPIPNTEVPSTNSSSHADASNSDGTTDDDLKFSKAKADFLARASGPKDELDEALELIRYRADTNGNQPIRNWPAYFKECLANFLDSDWKTVRVRIERAAKSRALSSPQAKAKAQHLHKTAIDHGWTDREFTSLLHHDFGLSIQPTVASIAQLSEWDYQAALTRFHQPPETICNQCGQRGCEHLRAEKERWLAEARQRMQKSRNHE
jgi:hypothetical protein